MNKTIILIMGRSGSGKSTLERELIEQHGDEFFKVISYTTRPKRDNEINGREYFFITKEEFNDYYSKGKFAQTTSFSGNHYGSMFEDYMTDHPYTTLVVYPECVAFLTGRLLERIPSVRFEYVYFDITEDKLILNMTLRGDNIGNIFNRLEYDDIDYQFRKLNISPSYRVTDAYLNEELSQRFYDWLKNKS